MTLLNYTIFDTPIVRTLIRWISIFLLKISGWRTEGALPDIPKFVMIAAPHTSNWDFPIMMFIAFKLKGKLYWMGKEALFRKPFNGLFKWLGGIPIDRNRSCNVVGQMVDKFMEMDRLILTIPPSGTRKMVKKWKSGFYHIAAGANVPVVLGFIDFKRKTGGIGPVVTITGDMEQDMMVIRSFYADIEGKYPEKTILNCVKQSIGSKYYGYKNRLDSPDKIEFQFGLEFLYTGENFFEHLLLDPGEFLGVDIIVRRTRIINNGGYLTDKAQLQEKTVGFFKFFILLRLQDTLQVQLLQSFQGIGFVDMIFECVYPGKIDDGCHGTLDIEHIPVFSF